MGKGLSFGSMCGVGKLVCGMRSRVFIFWLATRKLMFVIIFVFMKELYGTSVCVGN